MTPLLSILAASFLSLPIAPSVVVISNPPTYHLALTWDAVTNATSYRVEWGTNRLTVGTNYATVSNLLNQPYSFAVRAISAFGIESDLSTPAPWNIATVTHLEADSAGGPWRSETTNRLVDFTGSRFFKTGISNWTASSLFVKDR